MEPTALLGVGDSHIKLIENAIAAKIIVRGETIKIQGDDIVVSQAQEVLHEMMQTLSGKGDLTVRDVQKLITLVKSDVNEKHDHSAIPDYVIYYGKKGAISAKAFDDRGESQLDKAPANGRGLYKHQGV